jgi:hypothetical protein
LDSHKIKGFRGKRVFAPDCAFEEEWNASLQKDLESLFYVAVSCSLEDKLVWPRVQVTEKMRAKRRE